MAEKRKEYEDHLRQDIMMRTTETKMDAEKKSSKILIER